MRFGIRLVFSLVFIWKKHVLKSACFFRSFLNLAEDRGQNPIGFHAFWDSIDFL
jgi:hypothetical protein